MTSGNFHYIPIDDIVIQRDDRQRREIDDIDVLADSIRRLGLIHPLVITRENVLVSGERRLTACKSLGWTGVTVQYTDELDPAQLEAIELEENIKRKDIPWKDQVMAVQRYHALRARETPGWTQEQTAEAIGVAQAHISGQLLVAEEVIKGNALVAEAPKFSVARGIVQRARAREDQQVIERLHGNLDSVKLDAPIEPESILEADFNEWINTYVGPKFNFVHCDFPYGIDADGFVQGSAAAHGGYADTKETWQKLIWTLGEFTELHCTPSCHLMFWFAMRKGSERLFENTALILEGMGWTINPMPLIWMKSDGAGIIPDPERGPRQIYETCLLGSRGDRKIVRAVANAYAAPTVRERHMSEKPEPMLRHFFGMLVDENTVMLDPTCGSGSALRAAESLAAKFVLGLERNPEFVELARGALKRSRQLKYGS